MSVTTATALFETNFIILSFFIYVTWHRRICGNWELGLGVWIEIGKMWGSRGLSPSRRRHKGSGDRVSSTGRFLRFFNENDIILGIFELKFLLQNIF